MKYPNLFQSFQMGSIMFNNRLVMSPMTMNYATEEGFATEKLIRYYLERARGGVGLIIVEGTFITPEGRGYLNQLGISSPQHGKKLRALTDAVHGLGNGLKIFIQLHHAGRRAYSKITGLQPVSPSALRAYPGADMPHALSETEIKGLIEAHIEAAVRAKEAGFDGVDIHCAHGYLIPSFFSSLSNQRTDGYGGDLKGRTRFLLETISGIKDRLGKAFPLTIKISGDEFMEGGLELEDMKVIALLAQQAGIDGIMVSAGSVGGKKTGSLTEAHRILRTLPMMTERGCLVPLAAEMKKVLQIPVITVGRINHPDLAEKVITEQKADLVAIGRPLLADPYFPKKSMEGEEASIRPCIACNEGCYKRIFEQKDIQCAVNPTLGREAEITRGKASHPKRVCIVGAGPAGLEAAQAAWKRGHKVLLMEMEKELGGQLNLASIPPGRKEIDNFRHFLLNRLKTTDIEVRAGEKATLEEIKRFQPDAILCASGAYPRTLDLPGLEGVRSITAWDVIAGKQAVLEPVLVLGAGLVGCEAADLLSKQGKDVILVEVLPEIASDGDADIKAYFGMCFEENGVSVYTGATLKRFEGKYAVIQQESGETILSTETLVFAVGAEPANGFLDELTAAGLSPVRVGDCAGPRRIIDAVREGFQAGRAL